jgi:hypothetical protein
MQETIMGKDALVQMPGPLKETKFHMKKETCNKAPPMVPCGPGREEMRDRIRFQLKNGVLRGDGKPVFGLEKVPVPETGDRLPRITTGTIVLLGASLP